MLTQAILNMQCVLLVHGIFMKSQYGIFNITLQNLVSFHSLLTMLLASGNFRLRMKYENLLGISLKDFSIKKCLRKVLILQQHVLGWEGNQKNLYQDLLGIIS